MPVYHDVPEKDLRITLPSSVGSEEAHVWGPGELDYWDETRIRSRSQRTEVNQQDPTKSLTVVDSATFEYELLHGWLEHPKAGWDLFSAKMEAYERNRETIDKVFSGATGRKDREHILQSLVREFFPEMMPPVQEASPEAQAGNSPTAQPTAPSLPPNGPTGSIPMPEDMPSLETSSPTTSS